MTGIAVLLFGLGSSPARAGEADVVPAVEAGLGFTSNAYREENYGDHLADAGLAFELRPSLSLSLSSPDILFDMTTAYRLRKFFKRDLTNLDRFADITLNAGLDVLPKAVVGFKVDERLKNEAREAEIDTYVEEDAPIQGDANLKHFSNDTVVQVAVHPGGALSADVGVRITADNYRIPDTFTLDGRASLNDRFGWGPDLDVYWRFFPKTAIVGSFEMEMFDWKDNFLDASGGESPREDLGDFLGIPDGTLWQANAGLRGRLTNKLLVGLLVGYGQAIYDEQSSVDDAQGEGAGDEADGEAEGFATDLTGLEGLLFTAEVGYSPVATQSLKVGVRKDFDDVYFTNFVDFYYTYGRYEGLFFDKFSLGGELGYRFELYKGEVTRNDHYLRVGGDLAWHAASFLDVGTNIDWSRRASADREHPEVEYDVFEIFAGVSLHY